MADAPWLKYQSGPVAPSAPPAVIMGAPKVPTPYQQARDAQADANAAARLRLAEDAAARAERTARESNERVIPGAAAGGIQEELQSLRNLDAALKALEARPDSIGFGTGALGDTFTQFNDPEGTTVRAGIGGIGATKIHDLSGAAVSATEAPRFQPFVPTVQDRPAVAADKMRKFREELRASIREKLDFYSPANGYRPYTTPGIEILDAPDETTAGEETDDFAEDGSLKVSVTDDSPSGAANTPSGAGGPVSGNSPGYMQIAAGVGDIVQGAGDLAGIVVNPVGTGLYRAAGYGQNYDLGQILRDATGLPKGDETISTINRAATGGLGVAGLARAAVPLATGAVRGALGVLADAPISNTIAAGTGAASSETARRMGAGPGGQAAAGVLGAFGGYGAARGANALAGLGGPRVPSQIMADADRFDISLLPADVGGTGTRLASGAARRTLGEIPMAEAAERSVASAGRARDRVAANIGQVADDTGAGQAAQRGARSFMRTSEARGRELEERVSVPAEMPVTLDATRSALADVIRGFESNPELSPIWTGHERLRRTLEALTPRARDGDSLPEGGQLSWQDMRRLRTIVGQIVGQPGLAADGGQVAALRRFYGALTTDMEATAQQAGPRAATEFARVNQFWRGRESRIQNVLSGVLGGDMKKGEAAAFEQINRWAQAKGGDFKRLSQTIRSLPQDEADTVRASVIARMGQATKGAQNAEGTEFSPTTFVTQWNGLGNRAKSVLFPNTEHRRDVDSLARVFNGMKHAGDYANVSKTSVGTNLAVLGTTVASGAWVAAGLMAGGSFAAGKLLASPRVARILASAPARPTPGNVSRLSERLAAVAAREPILANDIQALQQRFADSFSQSPLRAAAEEKDD